MAESSRMSWPYPGREDEPWYDPFEDMIVSMDASGYAGREDPSLIWAGGGEVSWDLSTETLTWTDTINIHSPIGARLIQIEANSLADIVDGEVIYVTLTRQPLENITASLVKAQQLPSNNNARSFAVRIGDVIYFRTGISLGDGEISEGIAPVPGGGGGGLELDWVGTYQYTQVPIPVEETICYGFFDGSVASKTPYFWAIMTPTLSAAGSAELRLYDVGPKAGPPEAAVLVATLSSTTSGGPQYLEQALAIGAAPGPNQIQDTPRMYEVRAYESSIFGDTIYVGCGGMADRE